MISSKDGVLIQDSIKKFKQKGKEIVLRHIILNHDGTISWGDDLNCLKHQSKVRYYMLNQHDILARIKKENIPNDIDSSLLFIIDTDEKELILLATNH